MTCLLVYVYVSLDPIDKQQTLRIVSSHPALLYQVKFPLEDEKVLLLS